MRLVFFLCTFFFANSLFADKLFNGVENINQEVHSISNIDILDRLEVEDINLEFDYFEEKCTSLRQLIFGGDLEDIGYDIVSIGNGEFYLTGTTRSYSTNGTLDFIVVKINQNKDILWAKKLGGNNDEYIRNAQLGTDGSLLISGLSMSFNANAGDMIVINISASGNVNWSRVFGVNSRFPDAANATYQLKNGDYIVSGDFDENGEVCDPVIMYLDKTLQIKWAKRFHSRTGEDGFGVVEVGEYLYFANDVEWLTGGHTYGLVIVKMNTLTGEYLESNSYVSSGQGIFHPYIVKDNVSGYWIWGHFVNVRSSGGTYSEMNPVVVKLDENFNVVRSYKLVTPTRLNNNFTGFHIDGKGGFFITGSETSSNGNGFIFHSNAQGELKIKKKVKSTQRSFVNGVTVYDNRAVFLGSIANGTSGQDLYVADIDLTTSEAIGCSLEDASGFMEAPVFNKSTFSYTVRDITLTNKTHNLNPVDVNLKVTELCRIDTCITIPVIKPKLEVPDTVCVNEIFDLKHDSNPKYAQWQFCNQEKLLSIITATNNYNSNNPILNSKTVYYNGIYYSFYITNNSLYRLDYGNNLNNVPTEKLIFSGSSDFQNFEFIREGDDWYFFLFGQSSGLGRTVIVKLPNLDNLGIDSRIYNLNYNANVKNVSFFYEGNDKIVIFNDDVSNSVIKVNYGLDWLNVAGAVPTQIAKPTGFANSLDYQFIKYKNELTAFVVKNNNLHKIVYGSDLKFKEDAQYIHTELIGVRRAMSFKKCDEYYLAITTNSNQLKVFKLDSDFQNLTFINKASYPTNYDLSDIFSYENGYGFTLYNPTTNIINHLIGLNCESGSYDYQKTGEQEKLSYSKPGIYNIQLSSDVYNPNSETVCKQVVVIGNDTNIDFVYLHDNCDPKNITLKYNGLQNGIIKWSFSDGSTFTGNPAIRTLNGNSEAISMELTNRCVSEVEKIITLPEPVIIPNLLIDTILCAFDTLLVKDVFFNETCISSNINITKTEKEYALVSDRNFEISVNDFELGQNLILEALKTDFKTDFANTNNVNVVDGYSIFYHNNNVNPNNDNCYIENDTAQLIVNHQTVNEKLIWEQSITIEKATSYRFSFDIRNILNNRDEDSVFVYINNKLVGSIDIGDYTCNFQNYSFFWASGYNDSKIELSLKSKSIVYGTKVFAIKNLAIQPYKIVRKDIRVQYSSLNVDPIKDTALCFGLPLVFNVINDGGVTTEVFDVNKNILFDEQTNTYLPNGTITAYVVSTNQLGCVKLDTFQIESINPPKLSVVSDTTFCKNFNGVIEVSGANTYKWYNAASSEVATGDSYKPENTDNEVFSVIGSDLFGCSDTANVNVRILVLDDYSFPSDVTVCKNTSFNLIASGGDIAKWFDLNGNLLHTGYNYDNAYSQSKRIVVQLGKQDLCVIQDTLDVNIFPIENILPFKDSTVCPNKEFTISYRQLGTFNWTASSSIVQSNNESITLKPKSTETFYISFSDVNSCTSVDSFTINIHNLATKGVDKNSIDICSGAEGTFNAFGGDIYKWLIDNEETDESSNNFTNSYQNSMPVKVVVTEALCQTQETFNLDVNVKPAPSIFIEQPNVLNCNVSSVRLNVITDAQTIKWTPATHISNINIVNPIVSPKVTTTYKAIVTNDIGCVDSAQVTVSFDNNNALSYLIPDAFTPNGDGLNDCFGINRITNINIRQFDIFNRYGEKVFEGNNGNKCWNGYYKGQQQPSGTFVYIIKLDTPCGMIERKGTLALIK